MPILVISDIMCRVGPIVHKLCPTAAPENGVLPRIGEPNLEGMRQVDIPALASLPESNFCGGEQASQSVVPQEPCDQKNVYNLLRDASTSPPQQLLDFGQLLDLSASSEDAKSLSGQSGAGEVAAGSFPAIGFAFLARGCLRQLHRHSHHSMNLYEVVAVLNARITKVAACIGEDGDAAPVAVFVEGGGEVDTATARQTLSKQSKFSKRVLAVATGSTTGSAPALPSFSDSLFEDLPGNNDVRLCALEQLVLGYAQVSPLV